MVRNRSGLIKSNAIGSGIPLRTALICRKRMWSRFRSLELRTCILNVRPLLYGSSRTIRKIHYECGLIMNNTLLRYFSMGFNFSTIIRSYFVFLWTLLSNKFKLVLIYGAPYKAIFNWDTNRLMSHQAQFFLTNKLALLPISLLKYNLSQFIPLLRSQTIVFFNTALWGRKQLRWKVFLNKNKTKSLDAIQLHSAEQILPCDLIINLLVNLYRMTMYLTLLHI